MKRKFLACILAVAAIVGCSVTAFAVNSASANIEDIVAELQEINGANVSEVKDTGGNLTGYIVVTKADTLADELVNNVLSGSGENRDSMHRAPDMQSCEEYFNVNFLTPDGEDDRYTVVVEGTYSQANNSAYADDVRRTSGGYKVSKFGWSWDSSKEAKTVEGHPDQIRFKVVDENGDMALQVIFKVHPNGNISVVKAQGAGAEFA